MGFGDWLSKLRKKRDEEDLERAEERGFQSADERRYTSGDVEGLAADNTAEGLVGETAHDVDRLGD
jgi:hypothetical protein